MPTAHLIDRVSKAQVKRQTSGWTHSAGYILSVGVSHPGCFWRKEKIASVAPEGQCAQSELRHRTVCQGELCESLFLLPDAQSKRPSVLWAIGRYCLAVKTLWKALQLLSYRTAFVPDRQLRTPLWGSPVPNPRGYFAAKTPGGVWKAWASAHTALNGPIRNLPSQSTTASES